MSVAGSWHASAPAVSCRFAGLLDIAALGSALDRAVQGLSDVSPSLLLPVLPFVRFLATHSVAQRAVSSCSSLLLRLLAHVPRFLSECLSDREAHTKGSDALDPNSIDASHLAATVEATLEQRDGKPPALSSWLVASRCVEALALLADLLASSPLTVMASCGCAARASELATSCCTCDLLSHKAIACLLRDACGTDATVDRSRWAVSDAQRRFRDAACATAVRKCAAAWHPSATLDSSASAESHGTVGRHGSG